tara:strand:- start:807 stop:1787 length:981 start_codon:yes stop_codon:yes gene_type:complete
MADARERYIAKSNTPAIGSYGGGEDFGSPFVGGQGQPPGTTNEASVPYGGSTPTVAPPRSSSGNTNLDNIVLNTTGSGATGGEDKLSSSANFFGVGLNDPFGLDPKFGIDNYYKYLMDQQEATGNQFLPDYTKNLITNEPAEANLMPNIPNVPNTGFDLNPLPGVLGGGEPGIGYKGDNFSFGLDIDPNLNLGNMSINPTATANFQYSFDKGGPVGGPEIDQSGIASLYPEMSEKPRKSFGATRENVGEQLEAFRNAPVHVDPPNIGFMGEKIPAPLFDRAMKYLESLPPSERAVIEEMFRENIMKKRMQEIEEMQQSQSIPTLDA